VGMRDRANQAAPRGPGPWAAGPPRVFVSVTSHITSQAVTVTVVGNGFNGQRATPSPGLDSTDKTGGQAGPETAKAKLANWNQRIRCPSPSGI
jgi:hypothetical protein